MAVYSNLEAVVGEEGAVVSIPGNGGRIALVWVNVRGGDANVCSILLAFGGMVPQEMKPSWKQF